MIKGIDMATIPNKKVGFKNVIFQHQDFLKADLSGIDVLYAYHPFSKDFTPLMQERFKNIPSGTLVISNIFDYARPEIFTPELFERIQDYNPFLILDISLDT